jgi:hypothetical protein
MISVQPSGRFLITDKPDFSHPWSKLFHTSEPVAQKAQIPVTDVPVVGGGHAGNLTLSRLPFRIVSVYPGKYNIHLFHSFRTDYSVTPACFQSEYFRCH